MYLVMLGENPIRLYNESGREEFISQYYLSMCHNILPNINNWAYKYLYVE